jgi:hypothetical protein
MLRASLRKTRRQQQHSSDEDRQRDVSYAVQRDTLRSLLLLVVGQVIQRVEIGVDIQILVEIF